MQIPSLFIASLTLSFLPLVISASSLEEHKLAQLDLENIGDITTSVLDRLGYDCDTVADVGIVCKKCDSNSIVSEECTAYICDAVTKKCRKENAILPKLPGRNNEESETREDNIPDLNTDILNN